MGMDSPENGQSKQNLENLCAWIFKWIELEGEKI